MASAHPLTVDLHLMAGLGALALGGGALIRDAQRIRSRLFAALCAAFALWTLAFAAFRSGVAPAVPWRLVFLIGSCLAAPIGVHFCLVLIGRTRTARWRLWAAYLAAATLYASAWIVAPRYESPGRHAWNYAAIVVLGGILLAGLSAVVRHALSLPQGRERSALRLFLWGAIVAVLGGLSDFVPRGGRDILTLGPVAVLAFLIIVCALVVRHRFLDVDVFILRALFVAASAALAALVITTVARRTDAGFLPMFGLIVAMTLLVTPIWKVAVDAGSRQNPVSRALMEISRTLPAAQRPSDVWRILEVGLETLRGKVVVSVFTLDPSGALYAPVPRAGAEAPTNAAVGATAALPRLLAEEAAPITRIYLQELARDAGHPRQGLAEEALAGREGSSAELIVPLVRDGKLAGWISAAGGRPETYVRPEVSAALLAVAYQTVASFERLEALEASRRNEALAAVGEMAAGLAHEIRNPLAAIQGAAQVITADDQGPRSDEMLDVIRQESERLGRFVGDFLDYARPGRQRREPLDPVDLIGRALRAAEVAGLGLRATLQAASGVPPVAGDEDQILRAFANLIRNAREAAGPDGSLEIHVSRDGEERVAIRFKDDGPGIAPEHLPRLFRPFFTTKNGGYGLGLAMVHRVVQAHDGEVRAESRPGSGTTFTLVLPAWAARGSVPRSS